MLVHLAIFQVTRQASAPEAATAHTGERLAKITKQPNSEI
jgi:hypothetical protein